MEVKRVSSQASGQGWPEWSASAHPAGLRSDARDTAQVLSCGVTYEPGARTGCHTHPFGETLIVRAGCGWAQREGGPVEELRPR